jgi:dipeptidyl aminopeptidase/acylaminoacyl peptidase
VVLQPNYRGSTNLGDAYQHAIYRDGGDGPGKDVMAGVTALLKLGFVDSSRMTVSGWSYGGYMTSWMEGHYPVWKAAVAGAALNDYPLDYTIAWYQEGDAADFFGGGPYDARTRAMWIEQSPLTYADRVTAPTLIMGDVGDANVPIVNSYEMYHALKDHGVTVRFVAYPVDVHYPGDPVRNEDVTRRWIAWLTKYAK